MARGFTIGGNNYLVVNQAVVSSPPFTMAAWFNTTLNNATQSIISIGDSNSSTQYYALQASGTTAGDPVSVRRRAGGDDLASTSTGYSVNTWHHAAGICAAADDVSVFIDGGSKGTSANSVEPSGADHTRISQWANDGTLADMNGSIAEAAIWNVALTDEEVAILAKGYSPLFVRPENLVAYWPLIRDTDQDIVGGYHMTATNSPTIADHPPVLYPVSPHSVYFATAGETTYSFTAAGYSILKETASQTAALYSIFKETASNTAAGHAFLQMVASVTAAGYAVLKETASITAAWYAVLKESASNSAALQASIKMATSATAALQSTLKESYSKTAAGYSVLKETASQTAAGQAVIKMATSTTAALYSYLQDIGGVSVVRDLYAVLKETASNTVAGQAVIKMATSVTAAGYAILKETVSKTAAGYAVLKESVEQTAAGQAVIKMATSATSALFGFLQDRTSATVAMLSTFYERQATTVAMYCYLAGEVSVSDFEAQPRPFTLTAQERPTSLEAPPRPFTLTAEDRRG